MTSAIVAEDLLDRLIAPLLRQPVEIAMLLYIDGRGQLAGLRHVRGTRDGIVLSTRLLVTDALAFDARSAIMAHNHPSGDPAASQADLAVTRRLARAFDTVGVRLIDHIVLASGGRTSLRAAGYL